MLTLKKITRGNVCMLAAVPQCRRHYWFFVNASMTDAFCSLLSALHMESATKEVLSRLWEPNAECPTDSSIYTGGFRNYINVGSVEGVSAPAWLEFLWFRGPGILRSKSSVQPEGLPGLGIGGGWCLVLVHTSALHTKMLFP